MWTISLYHQATTLPRHTQLSYRTCVLSSSSSACIIPQPHKQFSICSAGSVLPAGDLKSTPGTCPACRWCYSIPAGVTTDSTAYHREIKGDDGGKVLLKMRQTLWANCTYCVGFFFLLSLPNCVEGEVLFVTSLLPSLEVGENPQAAQWRAETLIPR